jgi:type I restriction-modification system DNA methylase subunit
MALFQKAVEHKYLKQLNPELLHSKYLNFKNYFGNPDIQENIRNSKEEQFQEGFLRELFVNILDYTLNPTPDFNLTTEYKNIKDSKKADGAILINDSVKAVIELKGTNTTDLDKIEAQAFGYKNNQHDCVYVITSNFEKLRFYIDNAIEHIEFNLFTLTKADFEILYLCLSFETIGKGIPKKVKEESLSQEDTITKKLYQDYSLFKRELHQNLVELNPQFDSLTLFKKSQKLLDRFLFLFFAEDRQLLPPNSVRLILNDWRDLQERDVEIPLYNRFKKYFEYLNTGYKGKRYDVFAYNGGLFKPDEVLDAILIDDELLYLHTYQLSEYNFASDVDVNILGHIFENSLNELDEINAQLAGETIDKTKTKRKKDGVFYTPKYITKYIVENTVGKLCADKKTELQLIEEEYLADKKRQLKTKQVLLDKLKTYQDWLLQLTICDPACGSGAFLNQALDFLMKEHSYIDELQAKLLGVPIIFSDYDKSILENNLFGVDLNEESVEIAKLSLWLRTAQPNRKLNDLNNNIKCGNSLIDDPAVGGDKAFNWQEAFPTIFENGGFDVVIGNPPYVQLQSMGEMSEILKNCGYETFDKGADLYCIFTERGYKLLKNGGMQSYIMPNKWMLVAYGKPLRKFLSQTGMRHILNFGDIQFFPEATTYVCIFVTQKSEPHENVKVVSLNQKTYHGDFMTEVESNLYDYPTSKFGESEWSILPLEDALKLDKMKLAGSELKDLPVAIYRGILTGYNDAYYIDETTRQKLIAADPKSAEIIKPMVRGRDISAYINSDSEYLINVHNGIKDKKPPLLPINVEEYPAIKEHLDSFYTMLEKRGDKGDTPYNLRNCAYLEEFAKPKIIYPNMTSVFPFMYDESGMLGNDKSFILTAQNDSVSLLFLTVLFNSSLAKLWIWHNCPELQGGTREIRKVYFEHFPVPPATAEQTATLARLATTRAQLTADLQVLCTKFTRNLRREYNLDKLSAKLENWYQTPFHEFLKELEKSKVKLTLSQKAEWEDYFLEEQKKAQEIKQQIDLTDKEIDEMVNELYGVKEENRGTKL